MNNITEQGPRIACFVSSHGFGHATRIAAILGSIYKKQPLANFWIYGHIPFWFWQQNLHCRTKFKLIRAETDIGLVQDGPFNQNLEETCVKLNTFLDFTKSSFRSIRDSIKENRIDLILSDISPVGIEAGNQLCIPTALIENFTWDWIYEEHIDSLPVFKVHSLKLKEVYEKVDLRVQCTPFCEPHSSAVCVNPVYRIGQQSTSYTKSLLGLEENEDFHLITTGGIPLTEGFIEDIVSTVPIVFSTNQSTISRNNNTITVPMHSGIHFPDLVRASSCVIGKAGYGTICECWGTNTPLLAVYRENFRESEVLREFAERQLVHQELNLQSFLDKDWNLEHLCSVEEFERTPMPNGSEEAADAILRFINL